MNDSKKMSYVLAAGAIGCAAGYLFFTKSGQRVRTAVFNPETPITDKIEDARLYIERRGDDVHRRIRSVADYVNGSIEEGKRAFEHGEAELDRRMQKLNQTNGVVVAHIHRTIDNLAKTIQTIQETVLEPVYEVKAIVRGLDSGVRSLAGRRGTGTVDTGENDLSSTPYWEKQSVSG